MLKSTGRKPPMFYDKVHGWVRWARHKRRPSKIVRELKKQVHDGFEYFKDEVKAGLE